MSTHKHLSPIGTIALHLRRRADRWHYDFCYAGKRYRGPTGQSDLRQALAIAKQSADRILSPNSLRGKTFAGLRDQYISGRWPDPLQRVGNRHYLSQASRIDLFLGFAGAQNNPPASVIEMRQLIQRYLDHRRTKVSALTVRNDCRAISAWLGWLIKRGLVEWPTNPADGRLLDQPETDRKVRPPADEIALQKLMDYLRANPEKLVHRELYGLLVLISSGLRPAGATRVTWGDLNLSDKPSVTIFEKRKTRTIPLSGWARTELSAIHARKKPAQTERVYPYGISAATHHIRDLRQALKLSETLTLQGIRRLVSHRLYDAGIDPKLASRIMGNSPQTVERHYLDVNLLSAHEAAEAIAPKQKSHKNCHNKNKGKNQKLS